MQQLLSGNDRTRLGVAASVVLATLAISACDGDGGRSPTEPGPAFVPPANLVTESRQVSGFSGVSLNGAGFLVIEQVGRESLTITAPETIMPLLTSEVAGGMLYLDASGDASYQGRLEDLTWRVTLAELHQIFVDGAAAVEAHGIETDWLEVRGSGATSFSLSGTADRQQVSLLGASNYDARDLESRTAVVDLAGASHAVLRVSDRLEGFISGPCVLEYYGDPVVDVAGGGTVRRLGR